MLLVSRSASMARRSSRPGPMSCSWPANSSSAVSYTHLLGQGAQGQRFPLGGGGVPDGVVHRIPPIGVASLAGHGQAVQQHAQPPLGLGRLGQGLVGELVVDLLPECLEDLGGDVYKRQVVLRN